MAEDGEVIRVKLVCGGYAPGRHCTLFLQKDKNFPYDPLLSALYKTNVLKRCDFPLEAEYAGKKYLAKIEAEDVFETIVESVVFEEAS